MNVDEKIKNLENIFGIPVRQDEYEGEEDTYIVYTYEDERGIFFGDNKALVDGYWIQIKLYTPKEMEYLKLKNKIKTYFENQKFKVSIRSFLGDRVSGTEKIRTTLFSAQYAEGRKGD